MLPTRKEVKEVIVSMNNFELDGGWSVSDDDRIEIGGKKLYILLTICEYYVRGILDISNKSQLTIKMAKELLHRFWDVDNPYICGKPTDIIIDRLALALTRNTHSDKIYPNPTISKKENI